MSRRGLGSVLISMGIAVCACVVVAICAFRRGDTGPCIVAPTASNTGAYPPDTSAPAATFEPWPAVGVGSGFRFKSHSPTHKPHHMIEGDLIRVSGSLHPLLVKRIVRQFFGDVGSCAKRVFPDPDVGALASSTLELMIDRTGRVQMSQTMRGSSPAFDRCLRTLFASGRITFPQVQEASAVEYHWSVSFGLTPSEIGNGCFPDARSLPVSIWSLAQSEPFQVVESWQWMLPSNALP